MVLCYGFGVSEDEVDGLGQVGGLQERVLVGAMSIVALGGTCLVLCGRRCVLLSWLKSMAVDDDD